jgi:hypothetical protein
VFDIRLCIFRSNGERHNPPDPAASISESVSSSSAEADANTGARKLDRYNPNVRSTIASIVKRPTIFREA